MLDFMDHVQLVFDDATRWNRDNSYTSLTTTAQSLLDFSIPERLRVHLSSVSTPHFATSYSLGTVGLLDGSISYLFSTVPLNKTPTRSALVSLRKIVPGYRQIQAPVAPSDLVALPTSDDSSSSNGDSRLRKDTLLHATLHLPPPTTLNALLLRRISPTLQLMLAVSSTQGPPLSKSAPQAALLTQLSHDTGRFCNEYLFSTDNTLFGWRGLWNFGHDPRKPRHPDSPPPVSLLSAGAEAYYSPVSSLVGVSTGLRFSTLPAASKVSSPSLLSSSSAAAAAASPSSSLSQSQPASAQSNYGVAPISTFPYTLTLTLTPLTGSLSTTYSLRASPTLAFSSRFGFNVYSWESEMVAGCEFWRRSSSSSRSQSSQDTLHDDGLEWARQKMREHGWSTRRHQPPPPPSSAEQDADSCASDSVVKLRVDQSWNVRLLWEGRVKELLISAGVGLGPGSFSAVPASLGATTTGATAASPADGTAAAHWAMGSAAMSYWHGVGVSVSYSS